MKSPLQHTTLVLLLAGFVVLTGCAEGEDGVDFETDTTGMTGMEEMDSTAVVQLAPTEGSSVVGTATFMPMNGGVHVEATVAGLEPGLHGFHVHENGDCSAPDASSAGGHFSPEDSPHGGPDDQERHVGDLGNLEAGEDSTAEYSRVDSMLTMSGANSIIGRALVVHAGEDDLTSQPSGDSGDRLACGVIEMEGGQMDEMRGTTPGAVPGDDVTPGDMPGGDATPGEMSPDDAAPGQTPQGGNSPGDEGAETNPDL